MNASNTTEQCNCENLQCGNCGGNGCHNEAGQQKVLYVGPVCDDCVSSVSPRFLIPSDCSKSEGTLFSERSAYETCGECGFDHAYEVVEANAWHKEYGDDSPWHPTGEPSCGSVCGCEDCNPTEVIPSPIQEEPFDFDAYNGLPTRK